MKRFEWLWFGVIAIQEDDQYWEQWLWVNYYYDGDEEKAKKNWGWVDIDTNESSWKDFK